MIIHNSLPSHALPRQRARLNGPYNSQFTSSRGLITERKEARIYSRSRYHGVCAGCLNRRSLVHSLQSEVSQDHEVRICHCQQHGWRSSS